MIARLTDDVLVAVLDDVGDRLAEAGVAWALGGSASRRVRGADVVPHDVDLVVAADARPALARTFDRLRPATGPRPPAWRSDWLVRWVHPTGVVVEFIGGAAVVVDDVQVDLPAADAITVDWHGRSVPISAPIVWDLLVS